MTTRNREQCQNCFEVAVLDGICGRCGYEESAHQRDRRALKPFTELSDKYLIGRVLGTGGFGITYLAHHRLLLQRVALKPSLSQR